MSETTPQNLNAQQAVQSDELTKHPVSDVPTRGLTSRDFAHVSDTEHRSVQPNGTESEPLEPGTWDFGGDNNFDQGSVVEKTEPEASLFVARQKVKLATGIGKLAALGKPVQNENTYSPVSTKGELPVQTNLHIEILEGIEYVTNLPEGISVFEPTAEGSVVLHPSRRSLLPSAIDAVPAGEYIVKMPESTDGVGSVFDRDKIIVITDSLDGKRINRIHNNDLIKNAGRTETLMTALGAKFEETILDEGTEYETKVYGALKAIPTPNTLRAKAAELGVDIKFIPDQGLIDSKTYLRTFAESKFPVSSASAEYYAHDTSDDHLTAMVLGAEPLKVALRDAAGVALKRNDNLNDMASGVDIFTALLRETLADTYNGSGVRVTPSNLRACGEYIGLADETVDEILKTAQANARKYGIEVREFPESA